MLMRERRVSRGGESRHGWEKFAGYGNRIGSHVPNILVHHPLIHTWYMKGKGGEGEGMCFCWETKSLAARLA